MPLRGVLYRRLQKWRVTKNNKGKVSIRLSECRQKKKFGIRYRKLIFVLLIMTLFSGVSYAYTPVQIITPNPNNAAAGGWYKSFSMVYNMTPVIWSIDFTDKAHMYYEGKTDCFGNIATEFLPESFPFGARVPIDKLDTLQVDVDINILQAYHSANNDMVRYAIVMAVMREKGPVVELGGDPLNIAYTELDFWNARGSPLGGHSIGNMVYGGNVAEYKIDDWENRPLDQWKHYHFDFLPYIDRTLKSLCNGIGIKPGDKLLWVYVVIESKDAVTRSELLVANFYVTANSYCYMLKKTIDNTIGTHCGDANWDPVADVNKDGGVDVKDLSMGDINSDDEMWCYQTLNNIYDACCARAGESCNLNKSCCSPYMCSNGICTSYVIRGGASRGRPLMISTAEGLSSPFVIVATVIVILIIIVAIFSSVKMMSKKRIR
jgi:hypothetical protein